MSYHWAHCAPPVWDPLSTARWDQTGLGAVAAQVNYSSTPPLNIPQQFPPFAQPVPLPAQFPAQFPTRERAHQMLSSGYPALYPQLSGNFSAQAQGSFTSIHQSVTGPTEPHPAAWAAHMFAPMKKYRCGYCGRNKESTSGAHDKRIRIRCECGGPKQGGKARMHSK